MARKLRIEEMGRMSPKEYALARKRRIVVVLDNIRSMHNVGSVFRTADALRLERLYLCGISGVPPHAEIHKSALGAEEVVEWHYFKETKDAVLQLKDEGYMVWSLEQAEHSVLLPNVQEHIGNSQPIAIVLGNEVEGVQQEVIDLSDGVIEIEQYGTKHSMNVSVAAGIVMWYLSQYREIQ
ncbi:RNA methyltransferase [Porphyromonas levii]|uniref:TrmH family RNA methyltransferase n=1 Tax=Porphyromonas levii TaxID=28114 RepID=A0A4Y8WQX0_9PORP|nr:RNA methyltransferase [Porphyromonas levii]MBR8802136.1 tRNA (guanosine(18)-2'-O)-methyltransferase [Porphyromonas levii]MBR8806222.1 tRNA (guanosine(18)-2'-O)-methyltransferase [Porphyromonas levii]TFH96663.1 TrmH family RNA methyltransferase [Porphyromonas levii]TFH96992.1 TrmH family RNA methyltransferase [Porphyromonas levii]